MLFGAKKRLREAPGKGRMSVMKFQHFATQKRNSLIHVVYGSLLIIISITLLVLDPIELANNYMLSMKEGRVVYEAFRNPQYNVQMDTYIFNYTNLDAFISGREPKLKLEEIGPFAFQEIRTDENMRVDEERGTLTMNPRIKLEFLLEKSVAHYDDVNIVVPNLVLICFSTFLADRTSYFTNVGAYYSMKGLGANLVLNLTAGELMWGYEDSLVSLANTFFPGWIDFEKIGILDRFYAHKNNEVEIELKNKSRLYAINLWDKSPGLVQQGYTNWNSSTLCNQLKDSYEGMMISPNIPKDKVLRIFRSYGCKVFPFEFKEEVNFKGIKAYRFDIEESAFNKNSSHACPCTKNCVPDGFMDISGCYYGFPIALSKPYLQDVDPKQQAYFDGPRADPDLPIASAYYEPTIGAPLKALTRLQINVATRTSPGNPLAEPLNGIVLPYVRLEMHCEEPPMDVFLLLYMGLVVGPPLLMVIITALLVIGTYIGLRGFYEYFRTDHQLILTNAAPDQEVNTKSTASLHSTDTHEGIKEVTLLLNMVNETNI